jgi:hypothetical protein
VATDHSVSDLELAIKKFKMASKFASKPILEGGFGISEEQKAREWAIEALLKGWKPEPWIKKYKRAVQFALEPSSKDGLEYSPEEAKKWAKESAKKFENDENLAWWIKKYKAAHKLALKPIAKDGLGFVQEEGAEGAKEWALKTADRIWNPKVWAANYKAALRFALKPVSEGGLGYASEEAKDWALSKANRFKTISGMKSWIKKQEVERGSFNPGKSRWRCFVDAIKSALRR